MNKGFDEILTKEILIKERFENNLRLNEIAKKYNCSISSISTRIKKFNIEWRGTQISKEMLIQKYINEKLSLVKIGKFFNRCPRYILKLLYKYDIPVANKTFRIDIEKFMDLYLNKKASLKTIMKELNCTHSAIYDILEKYELPVNKKRVKMSEERFQSKIKRRTQLNKITKSELINAINNSNNLSEIKLKLKCSISTFYLLKKRFNVKKDLKIGRKKNKRNYAAPWNETGFKEISGQFWGVIKKGARDRNLEFNITIEYAYQLFKKQKRKCRFSGVLLKLCKTSKIRTASLDRIDSSKGYIEGNVQWTHKDINRLKMNLKDEKLIELAHLISDYQRYINSTNMEYCI